MFRGVCFSRGSEVGPRRSTVDTWNFTFRDCGWNGFQEIQALLKIIVLLEAWDSGLRSRLVSPTGVPFGCKA